MADSSILRSYGSLLKLLEKESGGSLAGKRVLEIGCGPKAPFVQFLRGLGCEAFGIDLFLDPGVEALKRQGVLFQANAESLKSVFSGRQFDFIVSREVMHVPGRIDALLQDPSRKAWASFALENRKAELEEAARKSLGKMHESIHGQLAKGGRAIHVAEKPNVFSASRASLEKLGFSVVKSSSSELVLAKK